jgi:hypothetical protein
MRVQLDTDFLREAEALAYPPIQDVLEAANITRSVVYFEDIKQVCVLGASINITIILYYGYGEQRTIGGDYLRVWMREPSKKAASCAHIIDHKNGTYTAVLKALWSGTPDIVVMLVHPREAISALYAIRKLKPALRYIVGQYKKDNYTEDTRCLPIPAVPGYPQVCDMTAINCGMSWFCGKPSTYGLECEDLDSMANDLNFPDLPLTYAERLLFILSRYVCCIF